MTFKSMCGISPEYLREIINNYFTQKPLRFSNKNLLENQEHDLKCMVKKHSFFVPSVWNLLSDEVRGVDTVSLFKKKLKFNIWKSVFKIEEV